LLITLLAAAPAVRPALPHTWHKASRWAPPAARSASNRWMCGRVSGSVEIPQPAGEAQVTVRSLEPSSVVGQYRIHSLRWM
jgi:hypothetical protein